MLTCAIRQKCVQLPVLIESFQGANISEKLYNDLDKGIDYGCIFTAGCLEECNRCPLCQTSKEQLVDVLSGNKRESGGECALLVNCATDCVESANGDITKINYCLRQKCAYHCFDGSCPKCSAFITRVFNQVCVSGDFRSRVLNWQGHCYEMFREIVYSKFKTEFDRAGLKPAIGSRPSSASGSTKL
uniref:Uncharacterized protein n=1 Tax=Panagrellus redivivus TaxID=6233 RepID=A0A7E4VXY8_PANRE